MKTFRSVFWCVAITTLCGCSESTTPHTVVTSPIQNAPLIDAIPVVAGPRPSKIGDARFVKIHDFHRSSFNEQWVCTEGRVVKIGTNMGPTFIHLRCPECGYPVYCEGYALGHFNIANDQNLLIRGKVFWANRLAKAELVSQSQMDAAVAAEKTSE